jgi:hypothetical protein
VTAARGSGKCRCSVCGLIVTGFIPAGFSIVFPWRHKRRDWAGWCDGTNSPADEVPA